MSWIKKVEVSKASGRLAQVHAGLTGTRGKVSNIFRLHGLICSLILISLGANAENESANGGTDGMPLGVSEETASSKIYIVQLRSPSAAVYHASNLKPLASSAPQKSSVRLEKNSAAIRSYTEKLESEQQLVLSKAGTGVQQIYSYKFGLNGFAVRMSPVQAQKLRGLDEVLNVWEDEVRPLVTTDSRTFLGLFDNPGGLRSEHELDGEDVIIAVIDSGIAPNHPSLADKRKADRPRVCRSSWAETTILGKWLCRSYDRKPDVPDFEPVENWSGPCESGEQFEATACNNKLIGARWFITGAENSGPIDASEYRSPHDADGHGTHTATTAAGRRVSASIFGTLIGDVEGMAPRARVAVYKACWLRPSESRASCNSSDLASAIDAAVADGVDIISYSVGSSMRDVTAPDDVALMAATKAGVLAVVAAGNDGPGIGTIGSPAGAPWVITAAASTRSGSSSVEAMEVSTPPSIAGKYATREALFSPPLADRDPIEASLVLVDDNDTRLPSGNNGVRTDGCQPLVNGDEVSGNIALMQRSGCLFTDMVRNAEDAGAVAALIYNIAGDPIVMFGESGIVDIPALMIGQADGNLILAELDADNEVSVVLDKSLLLSSSDTGNIMANFSARGPGPVADILKPDVTAPGVNIIAGFTPDPANAMSGENFAYLSGTSMSTPHVAGVAALLRQAHPDWSPAAIKSALMTSARQNLQNPNSAIGAHPFDYGAGHIVANNAIEPGLVFDVSDDEYDAYACGIASPAVDRARCDELTAAGFSFFSRELNQPSISVSRLVSQATLTRRVTNPGDEAASFSVQVTPPSGIRVDVSPPSISLAPGESTNYNVTLSYESGALDLWRFGSMAWVGNDNEVRSPIAVKPASINAPGEIIAAGGSGSRTFPVQFGYSGSYTAGVHGLNAPTIQNAFVANDPNKTFVRFGTGVTEHVFAIPPNQLFLRFSMFDALTDGNDDLDMYVYYCGADGSACSRIGESGEPTSQEQFNLFRPTPGYYAVYVHGFETDEVAGGPGANYSLLAWWFGENDDAGNMTANGPAFVAAGTTADVTVDWVGLLSNNIYLGGISHITPLGLVELTIITIGN
ncbi:MAG TPA: S8 family serine peptidase [Woeseiaceae bacterium]|nr:S8 family serine peptidase [Woeseiaceae bacterium]